MIPQEEIVAIARAVLSGSVGIVEGCRRMVPMLEKLDDHVRQSESAQVLVAVESETDEFPIGEQRRLWSSELLKARDTELDAYLTRVRKDVEDSCRVLAAELRRFRPNLFK